MTDYRNCGAGVGVYRTGEVGMDGGSGSSKEGGVEPGTEKRGEMSGSHGMAGLWFDLGIRVRSRSYWG